MVIIAVCFIGFVVFFTSIKGPGGIFQSMRNLGHGMGVASRDVDPSLQAQGVLSQAKDKLDNARLGLTKYSASINSRQRQVANLQNDIKDLEERRDYRVSQKDVDGATDAQQELDSKSALLEQAKKDLLVADSNYQAAVQTAKDAERSYIKQREDIKHLVDDVQLSKVDKANAELFGGLSLDDQNNQLEEIKERARRQIDENRAGSKVDADLGNNVRSRQREDDAIAKSDARKKIEAMMAH